MAMESRKLKCEGKVEEWMRKKKVEAEKKMQRLIEMKAAQDANKKPKEFKKGINFNDWLNKKNEDLIQFQKKQDKKNKQLEKAKKNDRNCRETVSSASYEKWIQSAPSKPKPVPFNQGLDSLRGSTNKIYINPEPWKFDD